ncbi:MAG: SAM-dependent chlorinase/fluorinase [Gammaproteobacteria bacterium]|nr:SAM-dependent chlorinase/fluorinase [Gammaproteobacteria bacterium]
MIVLVTDFGLRGPYVGQLHAVLRARAPGVDIVNLFADAPAFDPAATSYLLAAYCAGFAAGTVFLCVVDPGVGSSGHRPVCVRAGGHWFVGPHNGLFDVVLERHADSHRSVEEIIWRPELLSASFHGRDLYAPVAAMLACGQLPARRALPVPAAGSTPADLDATVYVDGYGNVMTGRRACTVAPDALLRLGPHALQRRRTFADVPGTTPFWYENSNGLAEIAVNRGSAAALLNIGIGVRVSFE